MSKHNFDKTNICEVVKTMAHTQYVILPICGRNLCCHKPILIVTFALWVDLYEVCSNFKQQKTWPCGNPEKKENTLNFVGFVLNAPISKFQSKCCWKSWLN